MAYTYLRPTVGRDLAPAWWQRSMNSVRSTWVMSCISRPANAIGMAPRPIRRWGISRSHSLAVKPHTVNPAGEGAPTDDQASIEKQVRLVSTVDYYLIN